MKLKIMIMALLLMSVGIGSAVNRLPATEFIGDVDMNGYDIFGSEYVDESDIDWSDFKYRIFNGTTGAELDAFISTHGSGTYYISQPVEISDQWVIDTEFVRFVGPFPGATWSDNRARFNITNTTSPAIRITNQYVDFVDIVFDTYNTSSTNIITQVDANHVHFHRCDWIGNNATAGVVRINEVFGTHIIDPWITMPYGGTGKGIVLYSANSSRHNLATYISGSGYSRGIYYGDIGIYMCGYVEAPFVANIMTYKSRNGLYIVPSANDSILNGEFHHCNFDFAEKYGSPIKFAADADAYSVLRMRFNGVSAYSSPGGGPAVEAQIPLKSCQFIGGYYQSDNSYGGMIFRNLQDSFVSNTEIYCSSPSSVGIEVDTGTSFSILGNMIRTTAKGIKIDAGSRYIVMGNMARGGITDTPAAMVTTGNIVS